jgi:Holliday junction resolvase RusA-like endonuclease
MRVFIPGNVPSSKNSRVWTGKFFIASKAVQKWRKDTLQWWQTMRPHFLIDDNRIYPMKLGITFVRGNKHKFDYNNMANTVLDEMVRHGWIEDDNADIVIPVFFPYKYDKEHPGVYLEIL